MDPPFICGSELLVKYNHQHLSIANFFRVFSAVVEHPVHGAPALPPPAGGGPLGQAGASSTFHNCRDLDIALNFCVHWSSYQLFSMKDGNVFAGENSPDVEYAKGYPR